MGLLSIGSDFFGLDIGTTAVRVVQMRGGRNKVLVNYGSVEIDPRISRSDAHADQQKLTQAIKQVIGQSGISTPNVAVGLPSQKVFSTVVDVDRLSPAELEKTIRFQADSLIPTPLSESKIDWALLGDSPKEASKVELLLSSVSNGFVEQRLDLLESIGLNVIAFEPDSLAITRALLAPETASATLILDMGDAATDLVIVLGGAPRLIRSIPVGIEGVVKSAVQGLSIDEKQAQQFVFKFGMSKDKLEGQIYNAINGTVEVLLGEIEKSIKFFNTRYPEQKLERVLVTGGASTLPEFPLTLANRFGISVEIGNSWRNTSFAASKQNELLAASSRFAVAAGLAERQE
ncbi:type IV pilus assembly protein PilM [Candidatus Saccharibacteria bacterium]|nr:type IV pilus assembly protein PilM [Candidatus Saccharibacteria bacterium]MCA9328534.1 type IV pilus assembly protein PilM [Candidatus Saccharibacteria bacterium]